MKIWFSEFLQNAERDLTKETGRAARLLQAHRCDPNLYPDLRTPKYSYGSTPEPCKFVLFPAIAVPLENGSDILSDRPTRDGVAGPSVTLQMNAQER